jgi:hypothetical protein
LRSMRAEGTGWEAGPFSFLDNREAGGRQVQMTREGLP